MNEMYPVWKFLDNLDSFEWAALWIGGPTVVMICGFILDYILQRQGFGPAGNAILVLIGLFVGLYCRYNYLMSYQWTVGEPYLTLYSILAAITTLIISLAILRNRLAP